MTSAFSPREIVSELDRFIVGQDDAKRAVAVALRNRWRRRRVPDDLRDEVTPKNILMIGPTGVGKTEIARRLARLAQAPFLKVEATKFTEVGYVGRDVDQIVRDLVESAIAMVREKRRAGVRARAEAAAEERILDALTGPGSTAARESFRKKLRAGELDDLPDFIRAAYEGRQRVGGLSADLRQLSDAHLREILALTYGMISFVDEQIGRVLATLGADRADTAVAFLSDHGDLMGDHHLLNKGPFLFDGLVRVPTLWSVPGGERGAVSHDLISSADFAPTACALLDVAPPEGCQGRSYAGLLTGQGHTPRDAVHLEYDEGYLPERLRHLRTARHALTWCMGRDDGMLFDLAEDPHELHNLWHDPASRELRRDLQLRLARACAESDPTYPPRLCHA